MRQIKKIKHDNSVFYFIPQGPDSCPKLHKLGTLTVVKEFASTWGSILLEIRFNDGSCYIFEDMRLKNFLKLEVEENSNLDF